MPDLNALVVFAKVAEAGSFSEAARRLGMPISTVSRKIADLEEALGVRLLERSTRSLRLTDIGAEVLVQAQRGVEVGEAVDGIISNRSSEVSGFLRLSAPPSILDDFLAPIVGAFQVSYPGVRVHILAADRHVDHISEGVDLVFRVGPLKDSSLIARPVLRYRHQLVASPGYLNGREQPTHPQELLGHRLLAYAFWGKENKWTFRNGGSQESISFQPHLAMNDYVGLVGSLLSGGGIGDLPPIVSPSLLKEGRLVEVMTGWRFRAVNLSMVHLDNRHLSRPVRVFKEFAIQIASSMFAGLPT